AKQGTTGVALASFGLSVLRKQVDARAPSRTHLLPDTIKPPNPGERQRSAAEQLSALKPEIDAAAAAFEAQTGRKPGQLSPEHLARVREEAGIPTPPPPKPRPDNVVPFPRDEAPAPITEPEEEWTPPWLSEAAE